MRKPTKHFTSFFHNQLDLSFAWIFNEYPSFVQEDSRRFVSQETGHLYIAKVEPSDVGNYTCVVTSTVTNSQVLGSPTPLVLRTDGTGSLLHREYPTHLVMGGRLSSLSVTFLASPEYRLLYKKLRCFVLHAPLRRLTVISQQGPALLFTNGVREK